MLASSVSKICDYPSFHSPSAEQSPYPNALVQDDSYASTTPSSANAPSNSSVESVVAESSTTDSLIEFMNDTKESLGDR